MQLITLVAVLLVLCRVQSDNGRCPAAPTSHELEVVQFPATGWAGLSELVEQRLSGRQPLVIRGVLRQSELKAFTSDMLSLEHRSAVPVRFIESHSTDMRPTNLDSVFTNNQGDRSWIEQVDAGEFVEAVLAGDSLQDVASGSPEQGSWESVAGYWRAEIDRKRFGQVLQRKGSISWHEARFVQLLDEQETPFELGQVSNGSWIRESVFTRVASTGHIYPAHIDCAPNLLYSLGGRREVRMVDMKSLLRSYPDDLDSILNLKLSDVAEEQEESFGCEGAVYRGELIGGDVLLIPTLWLHRVEYLTGGIGVNAFYGSEQLQQAGDPLMCMYLKDSNTRAQIVRNGHLQELLDLSDAPLSEQVAGSE